MNNTDKEKLIKSLQNIIDSGWGSVEIDSGTVEDIIVLLKEQEPKPVGKEWNECPNCGKVLSSIEHIHFCGICGQAVKWE